MTQRLGQVASLVKEHQARVLVKRTWNLESKYLNLNLSTRCYVYIIIIFEARSTNIQTNLEWLAQQRFDLAVGLY